MRSVESKKYTINSENASPSHRPIEVEVFLPQGESLKLSKNLIAQACQNASRKEKDIIQVVSQPQTEATTQFIPLTKGQIAEWLVQFGAEDHVAKKMVESLEIDSRVSLTCGYCSGPFVAIVERPELPESLQLPYRIKWTAWQSKLP